MQLLLALLLGVSTTSAAEPPAPALFQSGPGRFEVAAIDATAAQRVSAMAAEAWSALAIPLALPERFTPPIFVRLVPAADWDGAAVPFRVTVEPAGVVSLRLRWSTDTPDEIASRALVQALLLRLAVSLHGVNNRLTVPLWLEHACTGWWRTRAAPAALDALKFESARLAPPPLGALLAWRRGEPEPRTLIVGAAWFFQFLQDESTRADGWPLLRPRLLAGGDAETLLAASFPGRFASAVDRELWWQTGWHHLRRGHALPGLGAAESRALVVDAARFVFAREDGSDQLLPLTTVLERALEPMVEAELARRAAELNRLAAVLHPFYRNAGLSLAAALAAKAAPPAPRAALVRTFEHDLRDAVELDAATTAALDALGRK